MYCYLFKKYFKRSKALPSVSRIRKIEVCYTNWKKTTNKIAILNENDKEGE